MIHDFTYIADFFFLIDMLHWHVFSVSAGHNSFRYCPIKIKFFFYFVLNNKVNNAGVE